jgi:imidazole glycerol-phosphate synthase subunit HisH
MTRPAIGVVDYGAGNLVSIEQALTTVGADVRFVRYPDDVAGLDALVVPGVGAADPAIRRLAAARLIDPLLRWIEDGKPYLGICLGLQVLFEGSDEDGAATLGVLRGRTVRLAGAPTLPHIGWNQVERRREHPDHPLMAGIPDGADFYFVHSYAGEPADTELVVAETTHGTGFASVVARDNVMGVQFHPERSGSDGLRLLANFVGTVAGARALPATGTAVAAGERR